jgi:hypothetical protein
MVNQNSGRACFLVILLLPEGDDRKKVTRQTSDSTTKEGGRKTGVRGATVMEQEYHALSRALLNIFCIPLKEQYHKSVIKFHVLYRAIPISKEKVSQNVGVYC